MRKFIILCCVVTLTFQVYYLFYEYEKFNSSVFTGWAIALLAIAGLFD